MRAQHWTVLVALLASLTMPVLAAPLLSPQSTKSASSTFDVRALGAVGDGHTDDTGAARSALESAGATGGTVVFPPGFTYLLTDELPVPPYVSVQAAGAILVWTRFGAKLATAPAQAVRTGNGIRLNSNTAWTGGTLRMDNVPKPVGTVIPQQDMSGAFWNQLVIGHFNDRTTTTVPALTENIVINDVHFELLGGGRSTAILIAGAARNITISNASDNNQSGSQHDMEFLEITWGAGPDGFSYHPYNIDITGVVLNEHGSPKSLRRGFFISGAHSVHLKDVHVNDASLPVSFYIGDPGDPGGNPNRVNPAQAGKIATDLTLDGFWANNFNIGLQVLGDAQGSTTHEYGTHSVRLKAANLHLQGLGPMEGRDQWSSNTCVYIADASDVQLSGGELAGCYDGIAVKTPAAGAVYRAPSGLVFDNLTIHDMARDGVATGTVNGMQILNCRIYNVGRIISLPIRAGIVGGGANNRITNNTLGDSSDETTNYGIYWRPPDPAKSAGKDNVFCANQVVRAKAEPIGVIGYKVTKDARGCVVASMP